MTQARSTFQPHHRNSTYAVVSFHSFEPELGTLVASGVPKDRMFKGSTHVQGLSRAETRTIVGDVIACSTQSQFAGGQWSVKLKGVAYGLPHTAGRAWPDLIVDGDWVIIDFLKNGQKQNAIIGRVDNLNVHAAAASTGATDITVTITGRDATAAVQDTPLYFNPYDPLHNNVAGVAMADMFGDSLAGQPHDIIPRLLVDGTKTGVNYGHPPLVPPGIFDPFNTTPWTKGIDATSRVSSVRGTMFAPSILTPGHTQRLWEFTKQWQNPAFNELWLDSDPDDVGDPRTVYLHFRERPFVNSAQGLDSPWFQLANHPIDLSTVQSISLSRGRNRMNHIQVIGAVSSLFGGDSFPVFPPAYNIESIKRWGLRKEQFSSPYLSDDAGNGGGASNFRDEVIDWRDLIVSWNALNARYWFGTITLAELRAEIRVGQKVQLLNGPIAGYEAFPHDSGDISIPDGLTFYVEATQNQWTAGVNPLARTQLTLSRGYVEGDRVPHLRRELENWTTTDTVIASEITGIREYPKPVEQVD